MNFLGALKTIIVILGVTLVILALSILAAKIFVCWLGGDVAAWVQAVGAVIAIVAGFATAAAQTRALQHQTDYEKSALVRAACSISFEALETVSDRLEAALTPSSHRKIMSLQGDRTTEMILAMREFDTTKLPASLLSDFIRLRSHIFAINERISEVYNSEETSSGEGKRDTSERPERLKSALRVYTNAIKLFDHIQLVATEFGVGRRSVSQGVNLANYASQVQPS